MTASDPSLKPYKYQGGRARDKQGSLIKPGPGARSWGKRDLADKTLEEANKLMKLANTTIKKESTSKAQAKRIREARAWYNSTEYKKHVKADQKARKNAK
jgi:hypothetical protein